MRKNVTYNNDGITQLKGAQRVRYRPAVIFGSDGLEGCCHCVFEVLSNAIDEAREGFGRVIDITRFADNSIRIRDYGRGIPVEYNEREGRYNWELVFCELYAGGKFLNNQGGLEGENYAYSLGLNGLGLCATQYASEFMRAKICYGGFEFSLEFEKGENVGGLKKKPAKGAETGTEIFWRPDLDVFTDIAVPLDYYLTTLKKQAIVNKGLTFNLLDEETGEKYVFCYEDGIKDYLAEITGENVLTKSVFLANEAIGRDREDKADYKLKYEIAFCFSNDVNQIEYYHNSSFLEHGGAPDKAVKTAFVYAVDNLLKTRGLYKKDEKKIAFADVEDCLVLIVNSFSTLTSFENQTKKSVTNKFIQENIQEFLKKQLEIYFTENKQDAEKIASQILINKRAREGAEKTRLSLKKKLTGEVDLINRVEKFVNCRSRDVERRELYIVEGDSALGACKLGRDAEFQAIMPVRGKILNCLKADYARILSSDIITDLIRVLGCGVEIKHKRASDLSAFDITKLKWSKVIICTDADVDGYQIRALILTMFYRLTPLLIDAGKIYIAVSPLYEITSGKKTFFAYTDAEKNALVKKLGKVKIQRSKGLGENEPDMMWQTTMCPETRKLIAVKPGDARKTQETFELLLGDNLKGRKAFIEGFGYKYIDMADLG